MTELILQRRTLTPGCTIGELRDPGGFRKVYTLEDAMREIHERDGSWRWHPGLKIPGRTAIPAGRYQIVVDLSQRFGRVLPRLLDVPDFSGVRIHPGNTAEDTDGCILVGTAIAGATLIYSRLAMDELLPDIEAWTSTGELWLTVRNP